MNVLSIMEVASVILWFRVTRLPALPPVITYWDLTSVFVVKDIYFIQIEERV